MESAPDFKVLEWYPPHETFAVGSGIRDLKRLNKLWGKGKWRKRKGKAKIRTTDGEVWQVELHWYEAHGIGKRNLKIKVWIKQI